MISVYVRNCVDEIGQSVYGRDCRKPIHDAIKSAYDNGQGAADDYRDEWAAFLTEIGNARDNCMIQWALFCSSTQSKWDLFLGQIQDEWDSFETNAQQQAASGDGLHPPFLYM